MTSPEGAFWSAIDAETDGREGAFYVWTRDEVEIALGAEETAFLAPILGLQGQPFFEETRYVLHLPRPLDVQARERRTTRETLLEEMAPLRAKLLAARSRRRRPATDDKILADWNGIAIAGLAVAGQALGEPELVERAARAADFVLATLVTGQGTLLHAWRAGRGRIEAGLADYVFLVRGLLRLHDATSDRRWLDEAARLSEEQVRRLASPKGGFFNAAEAPDLLVRGKEIFDGALPGANGIAAQNFLDLHEATGDKNWIELAERTVRAFAPLVERYPEGTRTMSLALARLGRREALPGYDDSLRSGGGKGTAAKSAVKRSAEGPATLRDEAREVVSATALFDSGGMLEEGWQPLRVRIAIRDGWHLAAESLRVDAIDMELAQITIPPPNGESGAGTPVQQPAFLGEIEVFARARARPDLPEALPRVLLRYQACDDRRCLPPAALEVEVPA